MIDNQFIYKEKEFKFYLSDGKTLFKDLNEKAKKNKEDVIIAKNGKFLKYNDKKYFFSNPHEIEFTFPNNNKKDIFISNVNHLYYIIGKYKYEYLVKKNGSTNYEDVKTLDSTIPYDCIKFIEFKTEKDLFREANNYLNKCEDLKTTDLSLSYEEYVDFYEYIDQKSQYFIVNDNRNKFFEFLIKELNNNRFICLCGPKGTGKTTSILAFFRINSMFCYFYFNIKIINKYIEKKMKIKEIIIKELFHCREFDFLNKENISIIEQIINESKNAFEIFIKFIEKEIIGIGTIIIFDQYQTIFDKNYEYI